MPEDLVVRGACPHDCPDTCAWLAVVREGRLVELRGDPNHPHTRGFLCAKVRHYPSLVHHPDRILQPLKRIGAKGQGRFRAISWDEALSLISGRWRAIVAQDGAEAILPYSYSGTLGVVHNESLDRRFFNRLGASDLARTICSSAGSAGVRYSVGARLGADPQTIPEARLVIVWGANPASTHPHYIPLLQQARRNGAQVVLIDPRRTLTANHCDWHLAPYPGTDAALALGIMHILIRDGLADREYLLNHAVGFDDLVPRLEEYSPERVSQITRLPQPDIERLAHLYGKTRPALIRLGYGPQRHPNGGMTHRTVACLPAFIGQYGVRGGGLLLSTSDWAAFDTAALQRPDLRAKPVRTINMVRIGEALTSALSPVKSLYVYNSNPAAVAPNQNRVLAGLARDDHFLVVHEILRTDTTDYADIVLPAATQVERWDLHKPYGSLFLALNQPAMPPPGDARSNTTVFRMLAAAMGFAEPALYEDDQTLIRTALAGPHPALNGITLEGLRESGWARLAVPSPAVPFSGGHFPTASGKVELYSASMAAAGLDPLPSYMEERMEVPGDGARDSRSLYLMTPGAHHFVNSTFAGLPELAAKEGAPTLTMNPADAIDRGLADGDAVVATSSRGECAFTLRASDVVEPGVTATTTVWWNKRSPGGRNANALIADTLTDMGGGPVFYSALIEVTRQGGPGAAGDDAAKAEPQVGRG